MSWITDRLKYINSLPFPLTIKHYYPFDQHSVLKDGVLNSAQSWDTLRQSHPHFSISEDREVWLKAAEGKVKKDGQDGGMLQRAKDICTVLKKEHIQSIFSVGVGGAGLEYQIKKNMPEIKMTCSDYSPVNVAALKKVFVECDEIIQFDMK